MGPQQASVSLRMFTAGLWCQEADAGDVCELMEGACSHHYDNTNYGRRSAFQAANITTNRTHLLYRSIAVSILPRTFRLVFAFWKPHQTPCPHTRTHASSARLESSSLQFRSLSTAYLPIQFAPVLACGIHRQLLRIGKRSRVGCCG
jgi:hypothetical protein